MSVDPSGISGRQMMGAGLLAQLPEWTQREAPLVEVDVEDVESELGHSGDGQSFAGFESGEFGVGVVHDPGVGGGRLHDPDDSPTGGQFFALKFAVAVHESEPLLVGLEVSLVIRRAGPTRVVIGEHVGPIRAFSSRFVQRIGSPRGIEGARAVDHEFTETWVG